MTVTRDRASTAHPAPPRGRPRTAAAWALVRRAAVAVAPRPTSGRTGSRSQASHITLLSSASTSPSISRRRAHRAEASRGGAAHEVVLSTCNRTELALPQRTRYLPSSPTVPCCRWQARLPRLCPVAYRWPTGLRLHLPRRGRARLDGPRRGRDLGQVRDAYEAGAPGPLLDRGSAWRSTPDGACRDSDRREPCVDPPRGGSGTTGLRWLEDEHVLVGAAG
jgi:hypothetical protein